MLCWYSIVVLFLLIFAWRVFILSNKIKTNQTNKWDHRKHQILIALRLPITVQKLDHNSPKIWHRNELGVPKLTFPISLFHFLGCHSPFRLLYAVTSTRSLIHSLTSHGALAEIAFLSAAVTWPLYPECATPTSHFNHIQSAPPSHTTSFSRCECINCLKRRLLAVLLFIVTWPANYCCGERLIKLLFMAKTKSQRCRLALDQRRMNHKLALSARCQVLNPKFKMFSLRRLGAKKIKCQNGLDRQ